MVIMYTSPPSLRLCIQILRPSLARNRFSECKQVATVLLATARIVATAQIIPLHSPGGANVHLHLVHAPKWHLLQDSPMCPTDKCININYGACSIGSTSPNR